MDMDDELYKEKGTKFQQELKCFHFGSIGNTGISSHVIISLFKESSIHALAFPGLCHNTVFFPSQEALLEGAALY